MSVQKIAENHLHLCEDVDPWRVRDLVTRRLSGVPLAYLTGRQTFMGIEMLSGPEAMIPRRETELLGQVSVQSLRELTAQRGSSLVIDLCTGSGNLALAMAYLVPSCIVYGADINPASIDLAVRNAEFLGLGKRAIFVEGDLFTPLDSSNFWGKADLVTCNPPYISSRRVETMPPEISGYEPRPAFDGGPFGISILTRLVKEAPAFLRPGGRLCFEVGLGQGETMARITQKTGLYSKINNVCDENGDVRVLSAIV
jgi:release factor glutamine methyltransferase